MGEVMAGEATPVQIAGFLVALRAKGETADEIDGLVRAMLAHARRIEVAGPTVDIVGTGGDRAHTVNISTMAALVVAGAGAAGGQARQPGGVVRVRRGRRARGARRRPGPRRPTRSPPWPSRPASPSASPRSSTRHAARRRPRRELGVPTAFNFLGPLTNPAQPQAQAVGCADPRMAGLMAEVFARRGASALVFRGDDGLDELTTTTTSQVWVVDGGAVTRAEVDPARLGIAPATAEDLRGGDAAYNAGVGARAARGRARPRARRRPAQRRRGAGRADAVGADAGSSLEDRLVAGMAAAAAAVDSGAAAAVLDRWVRRPRPAPASSPDHALACTDSRQ